MNYKDLAKTFITFCDLLEGTEININNLTYINKEKIDDFAENIYKQRKIHKKKKHILTLTMLITGLASFVVAFIPFMPWFLKYSSLPTKFIISLILSFTIVIIGFRLTDNITPTWLAYRSKEEIKEIQNVVKNNIKLFNNFLNIYHNLKKKDIFDAGKYFVAKNSNWISYRHTNKKTYKFINK